MIIMMIILSSTFSTFSTFFTFPCALKKKSCDFASRNSSRPISFTASICYYGNSESSKYFCIIVLYDCVLKQLTSSSESSDSIYCVMPVRSEVQAIYIIYEHYYIQWFSSFCHWWSFDSLPLSPLVCLVGDTSFPVIPSTWLHRC